MDQVENENENKAFQPFQPLQTLQHAAFPCPSPFRLPLQLTVGLKALQMQGAVASAEPELASQTLCDGRLSVGTHLPLLAKRYSYLSLIGEGASAQVILAEDTLHPGGRLVAIKIMKRQFSYAGQKEARALRYIQSCTPECTRTVRLWDSFTHAGHVCLVLERLYPSLLDYLPDSAILPSHERLSNLRNIAYQLLGTVAVLHSRGIINADLKLENVLLRRPQPADGGCPGSGCPEVVIADFGSAFSVTETDTSRLAFEMQSLPYRAPEVVLGVGTPLSAALDVWSLGCILAELALQRPLFACHSPAQLLKQMEQSIGPLPQQLQRSSSRSGQQQSAAADRKAARQLGHQAAASTYASSQPEAPRQRDRSDLTEGRLERQWHEALSPLGLELAKVDRALADLVLSLLRLDPAQRLSACDALVHPFFDAISPMRTLMQAQRIKPDFSGAAAATEWAMAMCAPMVDSSKGGGGVPDQPSAAPAKPARTCDSGEKLDDQGVDAAARLSFADLSLAARCAGRSGRDPDAADAAAGEMHAEPCPSAEPPATAATGQHLPGMNLLQSKDLEHACSAQAEPGTSGNNQLGGSATSARADVYVPVSSTAGRPKPAPAASQGASGHAQQMALPPVPTPENAKPVAERNSSRQKTSVVDTAEPCSQPQQVQTVLEAVSQAEPSDKAEPDQGASAQAAKNDVADKKPKAWSRQGGSRRGIAGIEAEKPRSLGEHVGYTGAFAFSPGSPDAQPEKPPTGVKNGSGYDAAPSDPVAAATARHLEPDLATAAGEKAQAEAACSTSLPSPPATPDSPGNFDFGRHLQTGKSASAQLLKKPCAAGSHSEVPRKAQSQPMAALPTCPVSRGISNDKSKGKYSSSPSQKLMSPQSAGATNAGKFAGWTAGMSAEGDVEGDRQSDAVSVLGRKAGLQPSAQQNGDGSQKKLVNPALERARAASGSAGSVGEPRKRLRRNLIPSDSTHPSAPAATRRGQEEPILEFAPTKAELSLHTAGFAVGGSARKRQRQQEQAGAEQEAADAKRRRPSAESALVSPQTMPTEEMRSPELDILAAAAATEMRSAEAIGGASPTPAQTPGRQAAPKEASKPASSRKGAVASPKKSPPVNAESPKVKADLEKNSPARKSNQKLSRSAHASKASAQQHTARSSAATPPKRKLGEGQPDHATPRSQLRGSLRDRSTLAGKSAKPWWVV